MALGQGIEHDARLGSDPDPTGFIRRQVDVHIDIGGVEHREDLAAGRQHLADIGDAVLDAPVLGATSVLSAMLTW